METKGLFLLLGIPVAMGIVVMVVEEEEATKVLTTKGLMTPLTMPAAADAIVAVGAATVFAAALSIR